MAVVLSEGPKIPWRPLIGQRRLPSADRNQPGSGWAAPARHPPGGQPSPAEGRRGWRVTSRDTGRSDWWHQSTGACPWVVIGSSLGRHWVVIGSDSISQAPGRNEPILARVMAPLVIQLTSPPHRAIGASSGTSPPPPPPPFHAQARAAVPSHQYMDINEWIKIDNPIPSIRETTALEWRRRRTGLQGLNYRYLRRKGPLMIDSGPPRCSSRRNVSLHGETAINNR